MKKLSLISLTALIVIVLMSSCQKESDLLTVKNSAAEKNSAAVLKESDPVFCGTPYVTNLMAGQNIIAGSVTIQNTATDLYITVKTTGGWKVNLTHIYAGSLANAPVNGAGNPQPGQFPYSQSFNSMVDSFRFVIPLAGLDPCIIVAVHAEVKKLNGQGHVIQSETAWGKGIRFSSRNWGMYSEYCKQVCCEFTPVTFDLLAGTKEKIGSLILINDNENLYASFITTGNWYMKKTALYAGLIEELPTDSYKQPLINAFPYSQNSPEGLQTVSYTVPLSRLQDCYIIGAYALVGEMMGGHFVSETLAWSSGTLLPYPGSTATVSPYCTQVCR